MKSELSPDKDEAVEVGATKQVKRRKYLKRSASEPSQTVPKKFRKSKDKKDPINDRIEVTSEDNNVQNTEHKKDMKKNSKDKKDIINKSNDTQDIHSEASNEENTSGKLERPNYTKWKGSKSYPSLKEKCARLEEAWVKL